MPIKKRLPENKKLKKNINICITENQEKDIKKRAKIEDLSLSEYVRYLLFTEQT